MSSLHALVMLKQAQVWAYGFLSKIRYKNLPPEKR